MTTIVATSGLLQAVKPQAGQTGTWRPSISRGSIAWPHCWQKLIVISICLESVSPAALPSRKGALVRLGSVNLVVAGVTFVAAGVEWVEALTIVLAVGIVRGWRSAFTGTIPAVVVLAAMIAIFGLALQAYLPIVRTLIGIFLLLFGLKWLHKAILRSAGLKPLHDEAKAFVETEEELRNA